MCRMVTPEDYSTRKDVYYRSQEDDQKEWSSSSICVASAKKKDICKWCIRFFIINSPSIK